MRDVITNLVVNVQKLKNVKQNSSGDSMMNSFTAGSFFLRITD